MIDWSYGRLSPGQRALHQRARGVRRERIPLADARAIADVGPEVSSLTSKRSSGGASYGASPRRRACDCRCSRPSASTRSIMPRRRGTLEALRPTSRGAIFQLWHSRQRASSRASSKRRGSNGWSENYDNLAATLDWLPDVRPRRGRSPGNGGSRAILACSCGPRPSPPLAGHRPGAQAARANLPTFEPMQPQNCGPTGRGTK